MNAHQTSVMRRCGLVRVTCPTCRAKRFTPKGRLCSRCLGDGSVLRATAIKLKPTGRGMSPLVQAILAGQKRIDWPWIDKPSEVTS